MEHNTSQGWDDWLAYTTVITEFIISCTVYRKWMTNYLHNLWPVFANLILSCMKFNLPVAYQSLKICLYWCISERTERWRIRMLYTVTEVRWAKCSWSIVQCLPVLNHEQRDTACVGYCLHDVISLDHRILTEFSEMNECCIPLWNTSLLLTCLLCNFGKHKKENLLLFMATNRKSVRKEAEHSQECFFLL